MAHTFTRLIYHVVFSTKDHARCITEDLRNDLYAYIGGIVRELHGVPMAVGGTEDHLHLLVSLPASLALADAMRTVKTNSSRWIHTKGPGKRLFGWQIGYGAFTVSRSNCDEVARYIADQNEHHKKASFEEEFLALLKKHDIGYDPAYLWQ